MRWAHLQMRCANLQMRLHLNCENGRCRPLRRFPRHAAISPRQQGTMRRVSALTFTNAHFAHFYAQKGPFPKPQVHLVRNVSGAVSCIQGCIRTEGAHRTRRVGRIRSENPKLLFITAVLASHRTDLHTTCTCSSEPASKRARRALLFYLFSVIKHYQTKPDSKLHPEVVRIRGARF